VSGPLGAYYYPTSGDSNSLANLIGAGSRSASQAGLYHYTVREDLVPEGAADVSIGFHYVATDEEGVPLDTDQDCLPDYIEDANGDGLPSSGETDWTAFDSDLDGMSDYTELMGSKFLAGTPQAELMNPNDPDVNKNGILDGEEQLFPIPPQERTQFVSTPGYPDLVRREEFYEITADTDILWIQIWLRSNAWGTGDGVEWVITCNWDDHLFLSGTTNVNEVQPPEDPEEGVLLVDTLWYPHPYTKGTKQFLKVCACAWTTNWEHLETSLDIRIVQGRIDLVEPAENQKFCFSSEEPGTLQVTAIAQAWPTTTDFLNRIQQEELQITFTMDPIGDSEKSTSEVQRDYLWQWKQTFNFKNLPTSNTAFGPKHLKMSVNLWDLDTDRKIYIFYPARAFNHPHKYDRYGYYSSNVPDSRPVPNYFYYYMQATNMVNRLLLLTNVDVGLLTNVNVGPFYNGHEDISEGYGVSKFEITSSTNHPPRFFVAVSNQEKFRGAGYLVPWPDVNRTNKTDKKTWWYIDLFAYCLRHEASHYHNFTNFWMNASGFAVYDPSKDKDLDHLPDEWEQESGIYNPQEPDTFKNDDHLSDVERHDCTSQFMLKWERFLGYYDSRDSSTVEDWAYPGKNWWDPGYPYPRETWP